MSTSLHDLRRRVAALSLEQRALLAQRLGLGAANGAEPGAGVQRLVAYVVRRDSREGVPDASELRGFLRERLPEHMVPSAFVTLAELPRLPNGKVDLRALPAPDPLRSELGDTFVPPSNPLEEALARIWAELLGSDRIGVHDNFFEIGGDSILSIQVVARASRAGLTLTPDQLFQHQTIAELARVVGTRAQTAEQGIVAGPASLTPIQHWFFEQPLPEPHHWHQALWLEIPSNLDSALLAAALRRVILHHDTLRLRFIHGADGWRQEHALADAAGAVPRADLSTLSEDARQDALARAADELAGSTDLAAGPMLRVERFRLGGGHADRLLIAIHHLVVDPISWGILLEDLESTIAQLRRGADVVLPPKTTSFRAWSEALAAYSGSDGLRAERDYWLAYPQEVPRLPTDAPGVFSEASARTVTVALSAGETRSLLGDAAAAASANPEELLLAALVQAFAPWLGDARLLAGIERHGREALAEGIDLSRTVGWFTSFFPVLLAVEGDSSPDAALRAVKEQLRRVPGRGIGYGILRYLAGDGATAERLRELPQPEVIFNYSGRVGWSGAAEANLRPVGLPASSRGARNRRSHLLEVNAFVDGDRLQLAWTYSAEIHRADTVQSLAEAHLDRLRALIGHSLSAEVPSLTPSDFPEAGLSQEELDRFLEGLFS